MIELRTEEATRYIMQTQTPESNFCLLRAPRARASYFPAGGNTAAAYKARRALSSLFQELPRPLSPDAPAARYARAHARVRVG